MSVAGKFYSDDLKLNSSKSLGSGTFHYDRECRQCGKFPSLEKCDKCGVTVYCTRSCLVQHIPSHRGFCLQNISCYKNPTFQLFSSSAELLPSSFSSSASSSSSSSFASSSSSFASSSTISSISSLVTIIPSEHHLLVMEYLTPPDLLQISLICKFFYSIATEPLLWKDHCYKKWTGKQNFSILIKLNENIRPWKRRYYDSLRDSKRELITEEELCHLRWGWSFRHGAEFFPIPGLLEGKFTRNPPVHHTAIFGSFPWKLEDYRATKERRVRRRIIVGEYLLLVTRIEEDWGWKLNNDFGSYASLAEGAEEFLSTEVVESIRNHLTHMWVAGLGDDEDEEFQHPVVSDDESDESEDEHNYGYNSFGQEE